MKKILKEMIILLAFWIILIGRVNFEVIIIGCLICYLVIYLNKRNNCIQAEKYYLKRKYFKKAFYIIKYILILIKEIIYSNFQVAKIVMSPTIEISPIVVDFKTKLKTELSKTILANSITLTPGTLTVSVNQDIIRVHCLQEKYSYGLSNLKLEKILLRIEEY